MSTRQFNITYALFVVFALSTWLDLNGVWVELPLIVPYTPEGWSLPSYLSLAVAISNVAPIAIMLLKFFFKDRLDERIFIYIEIGVGIISCGLMAEYWNHKTWFAGAHRSVLFTIFIFLLGTLDTTSTITYADYMKRYDVKLLSGLFLGESLTSLIPSILAVIQGVGGEAICTGNSTQPEYSLPRFSVRIYFWLFAAIIFLSLIAFLILEWSRVSNEYRILDFKSSNDSKLSIQNEAELLRTDDYSSGTMSKTMYYIFLIIAYVVNIILFGILPSIGTYVMLPYSQRTYYISSIVSPIANPLSVVLSLVPRIPSTLSMILIFSLMATCASGYVTAIALLSPCPPLHDTTAGAIIAIACFFLGQLFFYYVRIVLARRIRKEYPKHNGLFWLGAISQMGALSGSIPMYFLINKANVFKSRAPCQTYC